MLTADPDGTAPVGASLVLLAIPESFYSYCRSIEFVFQGDNSSFWVSKIEGVY